ncbi:unnamed protein product [Timema podura]|uniref:Uncharacterized protein n=1 Tax=Timema podura TaxID=61482 RepID=A0ABN7NIT2_TIMPD|nr:unnamed protein product [Timema podura]
MSESLKRKGKNGITPKPSPFSQKKKLQSESNSLRQEQKGEQLPHLSHPLGALLTPTLVTLLALNHPSSVVF